MKVSNKKIQYGYIGVTHNVEGRWSEHKNLADRNSDNKLYSWMGKQGWVKALVTDKNWNSHKGYCKCIILYNRLEMTEAYQLEKELIEEYDLVEVGKNSQEGGEAPSGDEHIDDEYSIYYIYQV